MGIEKEKKDNRGGRRNNSGRKNKTAIDRLRVKAWFNQLKHDGGEIQDLLKCFKDTRLIEDVCKKFKVDEVEEVFPTSSLLHGYENEGTRPENKYLIRIGFKYKNTSLVWDNIVWKAAKELIINKDSKILEDLKLKYEKNTQIYSCGYTKKSLNSLYMSIVEECKKDNTRIPSEDEIWDEAFFDEIGKDVKVVKLPKFICDKFEMVDNKKAYKYGDILSFMPNSSARIFDSFKKLQIEKIDKDLSDFEVIKSEIDLYVRDGVITCSEAFSELASDFLAIDIVTQKRFSLSTYGMSKLPHGLQTIYGELQHEIQKFYET